MANGIWQSLGLSLVNMVEDIRKCHNRRSQSTTDTERYIQENNNRIDQASHSSSEVIELLNGNKKTMIQL